MTPRLEAQITNLRHGDELHPKAKMLIDEETATATFTVKQGTLQRLLRRRNTPIHLKITATTSIEADYPTIDIDDTAFEIENRRKYQAIIDVTSRPRRVERRHTETLIHEAEEATHTLLKKRADALEKLQDLKKNPRKTLRNAEWNILQSPDPPTEYQRQTSENITKAYVNATSKIDALNGHLPEEKIQKIYAAIHTIEHIQNTTYTKEEETHTKTKQPPKQPITTLTDELIEDLNIITRDLIDQT